MIGLEPVDAATVTILVDNLTDAFMPDEGPARRFSFTADHVPRARAATLEGGEVIEQLRGEHGFSALVTFSKEGRQHRVLFDTGVSPDGLVDNMRFLEIDPRTVETVVLSHGHFDHTTGLDGLPERSVAPTSRWSSTRSSGADGVWCCRDASHGSCPRPAAAPLRGQGFRSSRSASRRFCSSDRC